MLEIVLPVLGALIATYIVKFLFSRVFSNLPPGPMGIPIFGYSPYLTEFPLYEYTDLHKKYGPVFGYYRGSIFTVVLGDYASIKEAYNKDEFLDRPAHFSDIAGSSFQHVANVNGNQWKETRRFVLSTLRNLGMGKNKVEEKIQEELSQTLKELEAIKPGTEVNTSDFLHQSLLNNIFSIIAGRTFENRKSIKGVITHFIEDLLASFTSYQFFYPYLKPISKVISYLTNTNTRNLPGFKKMDDFFNKEVVAHEKNFDENNLEDFMDHYIYHIKKMGGQDKYFNRQTMLDNSQTLVFAGSDTTQASLGWTFLCMAKNPEYQEKMYQEIVDVLGKERMPSWSDKDSLPYTNAFIMEVARFKTVAPASDPHSAASDGTIQGFHIPKGTMLVANVYAVHMDQKLWGDPETFRPERFLSKDGQKVNVPEYWIPFLIGKRMCAGEKLASMQLLLTTATIVQKFRVLPPGSGLSLEEDISFTLFPKKPVVSFERRQ